MASGQSAPAPITERAQHAPSGRARLPAHRRQKQTEVSHVERTPTVERRVHLETGHRLSAPVPATGPFHSPGVATPISRRARSPIYYHCHYCVITARFFHVTRVRLSRNRGEATLCDRVKSPPVIYTPARVHSARDTRYPCFQLVGPGFGREGVAGRVKLDSPDTPSRRRRASEKSDGAPPGDSVGESDAEAHGTMHHRPGRRSGASSCQQLSPLRDATRSDAHRWARQFPARCRSSSAFANRPESANRPPFASSVRVLTSRV